MAVSLFGGNIAAGGNQEPAVTKLPTKCNGINVMVKSTYAATAATTGVKLQYATSIDQGATFSDFQDAVTTAPSGTTPSQKLANIVVPGVSQVQFKLVNLDGTNAATIAATYIPY
jgi:hypothetical protein